MPRLAPVTIAARSGMPGNLVRRDRARAHTEEGGEGHAPATMPERRRRPGPAPEHYDMTSVRCTAAGVTSAELRENAAAGALERAAHVLRTVHALTPGAP